MTSLRASMRRRLDPDERFGLRLTLSLAAVAVLVIPFLLLVLLVEDNWRPLHDLDRNTARSLNNAVWDHPAEVAALKAVSLVFGPNVFRVVVVLVAVVLFLRGRRRLALFAPVAVLGGSLLDGAAKLVAGRHRPVLDHPVAHAQGLSFPSGHALGSLVGVGTLLVVFLTYLGRRARAIAVSFGVVIVVAVGFSRVALGVHYVSDVLGGWVLGAVWLLAVTAAFATWRRESGSNIGSVDPGPPARAPSGAVGGDDQRLVPGE